MQRQARQRDRYGQAVAVATAHPLLPYRKQHHL